jgi:hypothetical protein
MHHVAVDVRRLLIIEVAHAYRIKRPSLTEEVRLTHQVQLSAVRLRQVVEQRGGGFSRLGALQVRNGSVRVALRESQNSAKIGHP